MKKTKIYNIILVFLLVLFIIVVYLIAEKYIGNQINEQNLKEVVAIINENREIEKKSENIEYKGYPVLGVIKISKIDIEYPILNKTTDETMKLSVTKFAGNEVNEIGNFCIAGHNNKDFTMFGKIKYLEIGDHIELIDLDENSIEYQIFDIYITDPNDLECVKSVNENIREITLITCTNGNRNRLIIKASEI